MKLGRWWNTYPFNWTLIFVCFNLKFIPYIPSNFERLTKVANMTECFHSRSQQSCRFIGEKGSVYIRKELNSHIILLVHKHGRRLTVLECQYDCLELMWKSYILPWKAAGSDDGHPQIEGVLFSAALVFETNKLCMIFQIPIGTSWIVFFFFAPGVGAQVEDVLRNRWWRNGLASGEGTVEFCLFQSC